MNYAIDTVKAEIDITCPVCNEHVIGEYNEAQLPMLVVSQLLGKHVHFGHCIRPVVNGIDIDDEKLFLVLSKSGRLSVMLNGREYDVCEITLPDVIATALIFSRQGLYSVASDVLEAAMKIIVETEMEARHEQK